MLKAAGQTGLGECRHGAGGINAAHSTALHDEATDFTAHFSASRPKQPSRTAGDQDGQCKYRRDEYQTVQPIQRAAMAGKPRAAILHAIKSFGA